MIHIEWGDLERTEAIETYINERAVKLFTLAPDATKLVVHLQIINCSTVTVCPNKSRYGIAFTHHQDVRSEQEDDLYRGIRDAKRRSSLSCQTQGIY
ncbi:MAG: hypothetical protein R3E89_15130 [Thiolinea sp.]